MSGSVGLGVALGIGAAAYLALAGYVWLHRRASGGRALVACLLAVFVWSLCYGFELGSHTVAVARVWAGLKFIGIVGLAPAFYAFVRAYTGRAPQLSRRMLAILAIEPVTVLTLLAIPATSHLVHRYSAADEAVVRLTRAPVAQAGALFWPHALYTYGVILVSAGLLISRLARVAPGYRRQAVALGVAVLTPLLGNAVYNLDPAATDGADPTPFLFAVTAVVLVWGFFRLRLLDLVPVARGQVVEQMVDGVLVLDLYGRVVDANPAGAALLDLRRSQIVGRPVGELLPLAAVLLERHTGGGTTRGDMSLRHHPAGGSRDLAMALTSLSDRFGTEAGRLLVVSDVTERMQTQRRLTELLAEQTRVTEILQTSLRPASLPEVPGLRLAARSVPAGERAQVGGDFYDVHPSVGGEWAFVIGDVSGKGVRAAVVTSMARYTARTLSAQGWPPDQLLHQLNDALLDSEDPERFCTVLYGRISLLRARGTGKGDGGKAGPGGVRIELASGGHPAPLIRRQDGTVSSARCSGTALGLLSGIRVGRTTVDLAPGDLMLAFTDGVTEARHGGEQFGEERVAAVLAAAEWGEDPGPAAADKIAHAVADRVVAAVAGTAEHRDDIAVLVLAAV